MNSLFSPPLVFILGAMIVVALIFAGYIFYSKRKKNNPVTPASIPPLPTTGEADKHFTTPNSASLAPHPTFFTKKNLMIIGVLFNILLIGAIIVIGTITSQQSKGTKARAAEDSVTLLNAIGERRGGELVAGGVFVYTPAAGSGVTSVPVKVTVQNYHCDSNRLSTCNQNRGQDVVVTENVGTSPTEIVGGVGFDAGECGAYQVDAKYESGKGSGPAGSKLITFPTACGEPTQPSPTPSTAASSCNITGIAVDMGTIPQAQCPTTGGNGMANQSITLWGIDANGNQITTAARSNTDGTFTIPNIPMGGVYNVCIDPLPAGYTHMCNLPRDDGHTPMGTACAKIDTSKACGNVRLELQKSAPSATPTPSPTTAPQTCAVNGHVWDVTSDPQAGLICPTTGKAIANANVELWGLDVNGNQVFDSAVTNTTGSFSIPNIPVGGMYNVCVNPLPTGFAHACNIPRNDNISSFGTQCAKIDTTKGCSVNLDLKQGTSVSPSPSPSPSPSVSPSVTPLTSPTATPTCIPRPACLDAVPACDIPINPNYCPPTPTPTGPQTTGTPTPTPSQYIVYITATPTPAAGTSTPTPSGEVITPTSQVVTVIPTVGNPISAIAIIIPALLLGLAFLL
jgi:hypothetical protein